MAIAVHSMRKGRPEPGEHALVVGAGGIGAFLIHAAARRGARLTVSDLSAERLEIARTLGAETLIGPDEAADLPAALAERGIEPTLVYEVTGTEPGLRRRSPSPSRPARGSCSRACTSSRGRSTSGA